MKVEVVAMAKNEHLYINEWVKHYFELGFDKICIYDNDELDAPYIKDFIDKKYLSKVIIYDIRGVKGEKLQHKVYTNFYNQNKDYFDWCLFCDIDEFLMGVDDIKVWLSKSQFRKAYQIRVKWKLFGDDDIIERNTKEPVKLAFKKEIKHTLNRNLIDKGNLEIQGKMIVRGGLGNVVIKSPHFASFRTRENIIPSILPSGKPCYSMVAIKENYDNENVYLYHYMTKSLSEFINQKLKRTDAVFGNRIDMGYYWRINNQTKEKLDYIKNLGLEI